MCGAELMMKHSSVPSHVFKCPIWECIGGSVLQRSKVQRGWFFWGVSRTTSRRIIKIEIKRSFINDGCDESARTRTWQKQKKKMMTLENRRIDGQCSSFLLYRFFVHCPALFSLLFIKKRRQTSSFRASFCWFPLSQFLCTYITWCTKLSKRLLILVP